MFVKYVGASTCVGIIVNMHVGAVVKLHVNIVGNNNKVY